ncbi:Polyadenylate-binding protein, partial [Perkinsus olseni]
MSTNVETGALEGAVNETTAAAADVVVDVEADGRPTVEGNAENDHEVDADDLDLGIDGDDEIMEMQHKIQELEDEAERLRQMTEQSATGNGDAASDHESVEMTPEQQAAQSQEQDRRSIYVGNVDYGSAPEELQEHFKSCGSIQR